MLSLFVMRSNFDAMLVCFIELVERAAGNFARCLPLRVQAGGLRTEAKRISLSALHSVDHEAASM